MIVRFEGHVSASEFDVVIHGRYDESIQYAKEYFGAVDHNADYRNRNGVKYLYSDFDLNHTFHVVLK